jgi:endoglucanase
MIKKSAAQFLKTCLICSLFWSSDINGIDYSTLPKEMQGQFPIEMPEYNGVEQLLLLSNRWIIVATVNTKEVLDKVNELSDGKFYSYVEEWEKTKDSSKPNWFVLRGYEALYKEHVATARTQAGEFDLDKADYYKIYSPDDVAYSQKQSPTRTTRALVSLGKGIIPGEYRVHYAQYSYLELPEPLQNGKQYTVELNNGKSVSFKYDEMRSISRAIKINQVGYLPDSPKKYAYLGAYLQEFGPLDCSHAKEFNVISALTGEVVLKGPVVLRAKNPLVAPKPGSKPNGEERPLLTGEDTYEMDLSGLKQQGEFFISVPGIGRSWTFKHSCDSYGEAFFIAARGLYHQRCGIAIGQPFTPWPRIKCHTDPVYESEALPFIPPLVAPKGYERFDVIGATIDYQRSTADATGGWHDASDWDRNIHHYTNVLDLLGAYELAPQNFYDKQLNIPESGDGVPDILSEAEYGLRPWRKSMDERNGVAGLIETWTHPPIVDPAVKYAYSQRTRWSSLMYAGAAAQLSHLLKPFHPALADEYQQSALKAYEFGSNPKNSLGTITIHAAKDRGKGEKYTLEWTETDKDSIPYYIFASLRLFILTGDNNFLEHVPSLLKNAPLPYVYPMLSGFCPWLYFSLFLPELQNQIAVMEVRRWKNHYIKMADDLINDSSGEPYRQSWPNYRNYWMGWGAMTMTNQARCLLLAYHLTKDSKYKDTAILNLDYMLGANPMGMSWTTGIGYTYPIDIQHAVSESDGIMDPVPGLTIYGNTEGMYYDLTHMVWESPTSSGSKKFLPAENWKIPTLRQWSCHPHLNTPQCEFTIHETMSSTIFTTAMLICPQWMPSQTLKERNPREDHLLFGYWFLP